MDVKQKTPLKSKKLKYFVDNKRKVPPLGIANKKETLKLHYPAQAKMSFNTKIIMESTAIKKMSELIKEHHKAAIYELATVYGFDAEEAINKLKIDEIEVSRSLKTAKKTKASDKPGFLLPYCGCPMTGFCSAIRVNRGLYTQCTNVVGDDGYCKTCSASMVDGRPKFGDISDRADPAWVDPKGKAPKNYGNMMKTILVDGAPVTKVQVIAEATKFGLTVPDEAFQVVVVKKGRPPKAAADKAAADPPKKRGRPRKVKPMTSADKGEDLIATLVAKAKGEDVSDLSGSEEEASVASPNEQSSPNEQASPNEPASPNEQASPKAESPKEPAKPVSETSVNTVQSTSTENTEKSKKPRKPRATKEEVAARKAEREVAKAAKLAEKEAEKAAKLAAKEAEKAAKLAAKEAEKAAKKEAAEAAKLAKKEAAEAATEELVEEEVEVEVEESFAAEPAEETKGSESDEEEEVEEETEVEQFEFNGIKYLKEDDGTLYDPETQEPVGTWDGTQVILED